MNLPQQQQLQQYSNPVLAKKLLALNSRFDAFSRELGEDYSLLMNQPVDRNNIKIFKEHIQDTRRKLDIISTRLPVAVDLLTKMEDSINSFDSAN